MDNRKKDIRKEIREEDKNMRENFKLLRNMKNWTLEELSQISGIDVNTLTKIENGQDFDLDYLLALCRIYNVKVSDIFSPLRKKQ